MKSSNLSVEGIISLLIQFSKARLCFLWETMESFPSASLPILLLLHILFLFLRGPVTMQSEWTGWGKRSQTQWALTRGIPRLRWIGCFIILCVWCTQCVPGKGNRISMFSSFLFPRVWDIFLTGLFNNYVTHLGEGRFSQHILTLVLRTWMA